MPTHNNDGSRPVTIGLVPNQQVPVRSYPTSMDTRTRPDRGRGYRKVDDKIIEVYDLDLAAYLSMRELPLTESYRMDREFVFRFQDPDQRVGTLAIEYVNSESARFADAQRRLKKVIISRPQW